MDAVIGLAQAILLLFNFQKPNHFCVFGKRCIKWVQGGDLVGKMLKLIVIILYNCSIKHEYKKFVLYDIIYFHCLPCIPPFVRFSLNTLKCHLWGYTLIYWGSHLKALSQLTKLVARLSCLLWTFYYWPQPFISFFLFSLLCLFCILYSFK